MSNFKNKRRSLLKVVAVTGAAASMPVTASATLKPIFGALHKAEFPMPDFASVVGEAVSIVCADGIALKAEIAEVQELEFNCAAHKRPNYLRSCASVVRFRVADTKPFSNDTYQLKHSKLGKMDLLLSVVPDANGELGLEAVFN
jgi:hypothetical protein